MRFKDKIVLITGSSRGIGRATALLFSKEGAKIVINYSMSEKEANGVVQEIKNISDAIAIKCDVSKEAQVKEMFKKIIGKFGRLDILINNAGKYIDGDEWNGTPKVWMKTIEQNLISAMNTSKCAAEIFQKQKNGVIVNVSSRTAISGKYDSFAYGASKAGLINVTQAYSKLLAPFGRVNTVSPGATNAGYWFRAPKKELEERISKMPGKKLIEPEEIASIILFLCSSKSANVTGQNIIVDGQKICTVENCFKALRGM